MTLYIIAYILIGNAFTLLTDKNELNEIKSKLKKQIIITTITLLWLPITIFVITISLTSLLPILFLNQLDKS